MNPTTSTSTIAVGTCGRALPGQSESGDGFALVSCSDGTLIVVIDGLGHGPLAASATRCAQKYLGSKKYGSDLAETVRECDELLLGTRGAVMTLVFFDANSPTMTWLSVGDVEGVVMRADFGCGKTSAVMRAGIVGGGMGGLPSLRPSSIALTDGDLLILATDGVATHLGVDRQTWDSKIDRSADPQVIAETIAGEFAKDSDDALVLVARWKGPTSQ